MTEETITSIDSPRVDGVDTASGAEIYTLQGVKINTSVELLPPGVYIVNKKKVMIR
jgi:hypothetical protein